ncbi:lipocalin-like domain-containing protein [Shewanella sp. UCD-KL12]|uniref:lipocalin-like domain-containing protein n=1 Tax=Shewanella sp. UCD-KL12 TaxID=1917163 RepID=UPI0009708738|nr:lipocalin-like domain-containing protein [Shewanella sp. UCD-KL12]
MSTKMIVSLGVWATLSLTACSKPSTTPSMGELLGDSVDGYTEVSNSRAITFPQDHQAHDDFRQEWWYLTANLTTKQGEQIGLQWTQFRIALSPDTPDVTSLLSESNWSSNQIYMTHAAITSKTLHFAEERWSRSHPKLAGVTPKPLTIKIDDWQWTGTDNELFPATLNVNSEKFSYRLALQTNAPYQLQGQRGYSIKSADGSVASHYYSQPFINVSGTIHLAGIEHEVEGNAWLDREWSSQFLNKSQAGWDWFAIRLDDGSTLMLFQLRGQTEDEASFYSGRRMYADGSGRNIASSEIQLEAVDWHKIESQRYPIAWRIAIPSEHIEIRTQALNSNAKVPLSISYWEGPISISGSHKGQGYMELTGY